MWARSVAHSADELLLWGGCVFCLAGGNGGWLENCGITLAINEMLVAANPTGHKETPWLLELFPGWPEAEAASFRSLRVKGGFGVSARYTPPKIEQAIAITSHAGEVCTILDPWLGPSSRNSASWPARATTLNAIDQPRVTLSLR